jgi:hypothetical protein
MPNSGFLIGLLQRYRIFWCACIGLSVLLGCFSATTSSGALGVPVIGNESVVTGDLLERNAIDSASIGIEPRQTLWHFKLQVISVENVMRANSFVQIGNTIEVYSNEVNAPKVSEKRVTLRISFRGDERTGRYWIVGPAEPNSR